MEYINAKELINLGIQTLPSTVKNVIERARRENWPNRKRVGRGGGLEYLVNGLPAYILTEVKERLASQILLKLNNQSLPVEYNKKKRISKSLLQETLIYDEVKELNTKQQEIAYARMSICQEVNKMHA